MLVIGAGAANDGGVGPDAGGWPARGTVGGGVVGDGGFGRVVADPGGFGPVVEVVVDEGDPVVVVVAGASVVVVVAGTVVVVVEVVVVVGVSHPPTSVIGPPRSLVVNPSLQWPWILTEIVGVDDPVKTQENVPSWYGSLGLAAIGTLDGVRSDAGTEEPSTVAEATVAVSVRL